MSIAAVISSRLIVAASGIVALAALCLLLSAAYQGITNQKGGKP